MRFSVLRKRTILEQITVDARSADEAVEKAKSRRTGWEDVHRDVEYDAWKTTKETS